MAFPTTGILDNFNRTNQGPPPTGWTTVYNGHRVSGNLLIGNTSSDANVSVWNTGSYGPSLEVYITLTTASAIPTLYILDSTLDHGYSVVYNSGTVQIYRQDNFGTDEVKLGADITQSFSNGDALGLEYNAATDTITAYRKPSGGSWTSLGSRTESTYTDMSRFGLFSWSTASLDDFGGGTTVSSGLSVNVSDTVTLSETVTVLPATRARSVSDTVTLSEAVTVAVQATAPSTLSVSTSDGVTLSETVTARLAAALSVSRSETVTLSESVLVQKLAGACIGGVLRQNTANGRYLENDSGIVFLAGFHTWYNLYNGGASDPPPAFTWSTYTASIAAKGVTHVRGWIPETARDWPSESGQYFEMLPWARTGPGNAADGHPKFDLATFNDDFFARLRARCVELGNAGIYVTVVLFDGFHIDNTKPGGGAGDPWAYHPFEDGNNINSLDGDTNNDGIGAEIRATTFTAAYNFQKAYVEKVIDTLNDLDNILFEISNEDGTYAETWQKALVDYIHTYESGKAKQHPVGMTKLYPSGTNSMLTSSNADWISPDEDLTPVAQNSTAQAWMYDTDHTAGDTTDYKWTWIAALQGYGGAWYMDPWDSTSTGDTTADATYERIRNNLGYVVDYVSRIDLENATPQGGLSDAGYALAKTTGAPHQYLAYQSATGNITLDVSATTGVLTVEWLRTSNGATGGATTVNGGASRTLTNPWASEDAVVYLWQSTYALSVSDAVTLSESVSVSVSVIGQLPVSVADSVAVSEAVTIGAMTRAASVLDAVTISEIVAAALAAALQIGVTDSATLSEIVSVALAAALQASVTDGVTISEAVAAALNALALSAADTITLSEAVAVSPNTLALSTTDTITLDESVTVNLPVAGVIYVSVGDSATLTETVTGSVALPGAAGADTVTLGETVAATVGALVGAGSDTVTLSEAVTVTFAALGNLTASAADEVTLTDAATVAISTAGASADETVTLSEAVTVVVQVAGLLQVSVTDALTLTDAPAMGLVLPGVSVADALTLDEAVTVAIGTVVPLAIDVSETLGITETLGYSMALPGVSVVDTVTVADIIVAYMLGVAHADWTLSDAAVWRWTLADSAVYTWTLSDRSRS